jgi:NDP-sugar pyrophosphorylase family protein
VGRPEKFFLVCNADNLTDFDVRSLVTYHEPVRRRRR